MPFIAGNLGGGTLSEKVAHQVEENRAASERAYLEEAAAPYGQREDSDDSAWFDENAEQSYLAQQTAATAESSAPADSDEEPDATPLPPLDSLVQKIPAETREVLENLFRAQFTTVRKIPKKFIK